MKYFVPILLLGICLSGSLQAQQVYNSSGARMTSRPKKQEPKGFDPSKLIYGGGFGLGFGDVTSVAVAPVLGYRLTESFAGGIGLGFKYYRARNFFEIYSASAGGYQYFPLKSTFFYPSVWGRYLILDNLFVQAEAEYDMQSLKAYKRDDDPNSPTVGDPISYKVNYNSPAVLLGLGYRQPVGANASMYLLGMYDVIQDPYSPYLRRIDFRIGFNIGW